MVDTVEQFQFKVSRRVLNFFIRSAALTAWLCSGEQLREFLREKFRHGRGWLDTKKTQQKQNSQWKPKSQKVSETDKDLKDHGSCFEWPNFL